MHWTYDDLIGLPIDVYEELLAMLNDEAKANAPKNTVTDGSHR